MAALQTGAIVKLFPPEEGDNVWSAEQQQISLSLPPDDAEDRRGFSWTFGPVQDTGYIDTDTFKIGVSVSIAGVNVGTVYGNLIDGVALNLDLFSAKGEIRFYLKNGNEIWTHVDIQIRFDGNFAGDYKIIVV